MYLSADIVITTVIAKAFNSKKRLGRGGLGARGLSGGGRGGFGRGMRPWLYFGFGVSYKLPYF